MKLPRLVLRRMSIQLKSRSDIELKNLLKHYEVWLASLDEEDYKCYSKSINQRIKVVKSEMYRREMLNTATNRGYLDKMTKIWYNIFI